MRAFSVACLLSVASCLLVAAAPAPKPGRAVRVNDVYGGNRDLGLERVRRGQVDTKVLRRQKLQVPKVRRQAAPSSSLATCQYNGAQPDTSQCQDQYTSDGCTTQYYLVEPQYLELEGGYTLNENGHVNFQYIPLSEYQGFGSYRQPDPSWTVLTGDLALDPNNDHPGGEYIGQERLDWSAGADLPAEGYCIIWVQVDGLNPHFGEGGQGPVCYCPTATRRYRL